MDTLSTQYHQVSFKNQGEIGIEAFSYLWPISRSGQRSAENFKYKKCLGQGGKYRGRNELCPSLPGTSQFVHSFVHFVMTFSVIIPWQHVIWCQKWRYELLAPWPMCPPSFIEIASKEDWNLTNSNCTKNLYYYYADNNNNNNNSEDETTQQQDPIPLLGEWDNNN